MKKLLWVAMVFAAGVSGTASAVPVTFDLSSSSNVNVTGFNSGPLCGLTGCGVSVAINPALGTMTQTLSAGQTWAFNFFSMNFSGFGGGTGTLEANLGFDAPTGAGTASGNATGRYLGFFINAGNLSWTAQPGSFTLADGTQYSVAFENLSGITLNRAVNVRAFLTLNAEPTAVGVPEPGTLALLGLGMLGAGLAGRRRRVKSELPLAA